jgi:hypothetical protein
MSAQASDRLRPAEAVGGLLAAASIFVSLIALVYRPMRITPFTIAVALIAAGIGGRHNRLAAFAVGVGALCWFAGMTIAILLGKPIY